MREQPLWTWHVLAGLIILVVLGLHMTIMHLETLVGVFLTADNHNPVSWANVAARAKQTWFLGSYLLLLAAALFHGLYGFRNILFELGPGAALKTGLNGALTLLGLAMFVYGAWAAWAATALAKTL